jgi:threonyl-tRNA synthetase
MKIPYMIILGDQELEEKTVSVRKRGENSTSSMSVQDFVKLYTKEVEKGL